MDLNVSISAASDELFEDNDMVYPVSMGRENLKIVVSPGSESSGVSSLDSDDAKKSPITVSEPSSAVQTEGESSDGSGSDGDDEKPTEQSQTEENVQMADDDENEQPLSVLESSATTVIEVASTIAGSVDTSVTNDTIADDNVIADNNNGNDDMLEIANNGEKTETDVEQLNVTAEKVEQSQPELVDDENVVDNDDGAAAAAATADQITTVPPPVYEPKYRLPTIEEMIEYDKLKIMYEGRDILDFTSHIINQSWNVKYAELPDKNYQMYILNRSQYNRLAPGYERPTNYLLYSCGDCAFSFPVSTVDVLQKNAYQHECVANNVGMPTLNAANNDMVQQPSTSSSYVGGGVGVGAHSNDTPIQNLNMLAQKLSAQTMATTMRPINGQGNFGNNIRGNASSANQFAYHNQFGNMCGTSMANNQNGYKQNNTNNGYYNNSNNSNNTINALANQMGNNNFMNQMNGTTNNTSNQLNQQALVNLIHSNRQQQQQQQQNYGYNRNPQQNMNNHKSGINYNNSHKQMPTYSHF